jgi:hypothetical protein
MNVIINCTVTLSKKLEKICSDSPIFLSVANMDGNKGLGVLKIGVNSGVSTDDIKQLGETSLMIKVDDVVDETQDLGDEKPVGNIYLGNSLGAGSVSNKTLHKLESTPITSPVSPRKHTNVVDAIAITDPAEEVAKYKNNKQYEQTFVSDYDGLSELLDGIKNIEETMPPPEKDVKLTRQGAIEREKLLNKLPKLSKRVFVRNSTESKLCIEDLSLILQPHEVFDVSTKPPKIIKDSQQLKYCCRKGLLEFVSEDQYHKWVDRSVDGESFDKETLPVFDHPDQAMEHMENSSLDGNGRKASMEHTKFINAKEKRVVPNAILKSSRTEPSVDMGDKDDIDVFDLSGDLRDNDAELSNGNESDANMELDSSPQSLNDILGEISDGDIAINTDIAQLAQDLPESRGNALSSSGKSCQGSSHKSTVPLMSDKVKSSDKKTIKRLG